MSVLPDRVLRTIRRHDLIPRGSRVAAAISGGPDSVALARVLDELQRAGGFTLAGLVHFNHKLRGEAAEEDERFCRSVAAVIGVPIDVESADVGTLAGQWGVSVEAAGRRARYEFFERAAVRLGADCIAVGHTRNDQAETFLLRLLRGAGPRGLGGIYPRAGAVVRPLLEATRDDVMAYLGARNLAWRADESNEDVTIPRNRVRHELVPFLQQRFSPGIVDVLAREADLARDEEAWLDMSAIEMASSVVLDKEGTRIRLDAAALQAVPVPLARRIVRGVLAEVEGARFAGFGHVDAVLGLEPEQALDLPGVHVARCGAEIIIRPRSPREADEPNGFAYSLSIPGEVAVVEAGWVISAEPGVGASEGLAARGHEVTVQAEGLGRELVVRSRRPGDSLRPLGLGGRKKLQDLLVDRKVARAERDRLPLVVDRNDRIVWVVGQTVAEDFRVTAPAASVILLKARRLGGLG
ncbi:MAG TPA: tRNA lysidine(34) synthetase TilS [Vicinamibacterales bacterium]